VISNGRAGSSPARGTRKTFASKGFKQNWLIDHLSNFALINQKSNQLKIDQCNYYPTAAA
jgi:hypothetical protein